MRAFKQASISAKISDFDDVVGLSAPAKAAGILCSRYCAA
jgi:hypothetical protein